MIYSYILLQEAQEEYESSLLWYLERSIDAAENFITLIDQSLEDLCQNPFRGKNSFGIFHELILDK